jgi:demethylmenaquinone methyltransferase/2-methoxy-6-polyprenyl-1,4-benzoquinol methylase
VDDGLLEGQLAYYRARAEEYDEWFLRKGRHDRGPEWNRRWFLELERVRQELDRFRPTGRVLELACGTGLWTVRLARHTASITAVDASQEVLDINRARLQESHPEVSVRYVRADLFDWRPDDAYDVVFFGFWLSHVPPGRFAAFWDLVRSALRPGGRVFFVDSLRTETRPEKESAGWAPGTILRSDDSTTGESSGSSRSSTTPQALERASPTWVGASRCAPQINTYSTVSASSAGNRRVI